MIRCRLPELMDRPLLDEHQHTHALEALNLINRMLGTDQVLYARLRKVSGGDPSSVLDLGSGGGGFLGYIASQNADGTDQILLGLDKSAFAIRQAKRWQANNIRWLCADVLHMQLAHNSVDWVTSSLFLHHFDAEVVVDILRAASRVARKGVVMADLTRSRPALALTWLATRLISRSHVFHVDGPRSVRAAFRPRELQGLAESAGLKARESSDDFHSACFSSGARLRSALYEPTNG